MEENKAARKVMEIVKERGPVIPTEISKEIGTSSILASAILSELVSNNQLKISHVKIGGTPFYYAHGQEEKLQNYTKYLHEKEKRAYQMLKTEFVLRDKNLEPVIRVALRQIKDFATPLNVKNNGEVEMFWKWYLMSNEEAEPIIKKILGIKEKYEDKKLQEDLLAVKKTREKQVVAKKRLKTVIKKNGEEFLKKIMSYFSQSGIEVVENFPRKKRKEMEFIISVPSSVGTIKYFCKAKDKKNCNDGDLSTACVQGQAKKLPVLFLITGKLTKKAEEMLDKEFSNMNVKNL